jgi:hypothetical protein
MQGSKIIQALENHLADIVPLFEAYRQFITAVENYLKVKFIHTDH